MVLIFSNTIDITTVLNNANLQVINNKSPNHQQYPDGYLTTAICTLKIKDDALLT